MSDRVPISRLVRSSPEERPKKNLDKSFSAAMEQVQSGQSRRDDAFRSWWQESRNSVSGVGSRIYPAPQT